MADFPEPVGASSMTNFFPLSKASNTASIHSFWPGRNSSKGNFSFNWVKSYIRCRPLSIKYWGCRGVF